MGSDRAETRFRKQLRGERERRGWSQADVAKMLSDKGIDGIYPTTIAKLEAGDRAVRIDEAAAIADLFEVSLDALLGRGPQNPQNDLAYTLRWFLDMARHAPNEVWGIAAALRERLEDVAAFEFDGRETLLSDGGRACDALDAAAAALSAVGMFPFPREVAVRPGSPDAADVLAVAYSRITQATREGVEEGSVADR
jgi:transcriptional regulator with XRE-family HTH domain